MNTRNIVLGLVAVCMIGMLLSSLVYAESAIQHGEESDGDHDRLQSEDHPNEVVMNGVGNYATADPPRNGIGR